MDFQIVIDSREKEQYAFSCSTVRRKLDAGDYSIAGHELSVAVERKSLPDFVHTVIHDFQRFAAELDKLKAMDAACVVVEADLDALLRDQHRETLRGVAPTSLLGMSLYISLRWTVPVSGAVRGKRPTRPGLLTGELLEDSGSCFRESTNPKRKRRSKRQRIRSIGPLGRRAFNATAQSQVHQKQQAVFQ